MATIKINDAEFYYELPDKGQPVILNAGYTCDHRFYLPLLDGPQQHFQVLIFDNRGVGQTKDDGRKLSTDLLAEDAVSLAKVLKFEKPHIVGQSMGGTIH